MMLFFGIETVKIINLLLKKKSDWKVWLNRSSEHGTKKSKQSLMLRVQMERLFT